MKRIIRTSAVLLTAVLLLSLAGCGASDGKTHLKFQIWDTAQQPGMEAMCAAYTAQHPDVVIDVQIVSWNEYWTKLEAAAESNTMPDIFWMHTNQLLYYADFGMLADVTELYDDVEDGYYQNHFSEISLGNVSGSDGRYYGVPKDKDNGVLVYNKEMFDAAGVSYPDDDWTWDDLVDASQKIYDATGNYGYLAYLDDQLGYWSYVYQNGGYILSADKTTSGFDQPGGKEAMEFYIGMQQEEWCPDQNFFTQNGAGATFWSERGAMFMEGSWSLLGAIENNPHMDGKWDIAKLPKAPNPVSTPESLDQDGRACMSNGLCYATAAHGKHREIALDVIKFFGTEEAQLIQGRSGAAIPAYLGAEESWREAWDKFDYKINIDCIFEQFDYAIQVPYNSASPRWKSQVSDVLAQIYAGNQEVSSGLDKIAEIVNTETAKKLADN